MPDGLRCALCFLTRLPLRPPHRWDLAAAAPWFPLAGALAGGLTALCDWAAGLLWGPGLQSVLALAAAWWLTGGLHLDGWMDTADGLASGRTGRAMRAVMRDSRVGAAGAAAGALWLLAAHAALASLPAPGRWGALVAAAATGRWAAVWAARYPPAAGAGLGAGLAGRLRPWQVALAAAAALGMAAGAGVLTVGSGAPPGGAGRGGAAWLAASLAAAAATAATRRRLGGVTGDVMGAAVQLAELCVLAAWAATWQGG